MSMTLYSDHGHNGFERLEQIEAAVSVCTGSPTMETRFHLLEDKIVTPRIGGVIDRSRLFGSLERFANTHPATLITGRTGSGKTALAAGFVRERNAAWLRVEPAENAWCTFARYLEAAILKGCGRDPNSGTMKWSSPALDRTKIIDVLDAMRPPKGNEPAIVVIDDLHHVFDADWFIDVFTLMVLAIPETMHLILLSRSKPPTPLWRLRSKQMLGLIDESQLAFTPQEAVELFSRYGLPRGKAVDTQTREFGRASRMMESVSTRRIEASR